MLDVSPMSYVHGVRNGRQLPCEASDFGGRVTATGLGSGLHHDELRGGASAVLYVSTVPLLVAATNGQGCFESTNPGAGRAS